MEISCYSVEIDNSLERIFLSAVETLVVAVVEKRSSQRLVHHRRLNVAVTRTRVVENLAAIRSVHALGIYVRLIENYKL